MPRRRKEEADAKKRTFGLKDVWGGRKKDMVESRKINKTEESQRRSIDCGT